MNIIRSTKCMLSKSSEWNNKHMKVSFVPTMGALHNGHLSLIELAKKKSDIVIVSIYVNQIQFNDYEDFKKYPIDHINDIKICKSVGVDLLFIPEADDIGRDIDNFFYTNNLNNILCGKSRPGHFNGVCAIVHKLFSIIKPDIAIFGEKDLQQLIIIKKMVLDLKLPLEILSSPTCREVDGLALSSRNSRLTEKERKIAPIIYKSLVNTREYFFCGNLGSHDLISYTYNYLNNFPDIKVDYIKVVELKNLNEITYITNSSVIMIAALIGSIRLIDNIILLK